MLGTVAQKDYTVDDPETKDLYSIGTMAEILKILEMPDGSTSVIIQGKRRYGIREFVWKNPITKLVFPMTIFSRKMTEFLQLSVH